MEPVRATHAPNSQPTGRRHVLHTAAALAAAVALCGCCILRRAPRPICSNSPEVSYPSGPLTIDAHCHVFNGTDLQLREFFSRVAVRQGGALGLGARVMGSILQQLAWSTAPSGGAEVRELRRLSTALQTCTPSEQRLETENLRQQAYLQGRQELRSAVQRSVEFRTVQKRRALPQRDREPASAESEAKDQAVRIIEELPRI